MLYLFGSLAGLAVYFTMSPAQQDIWFNAFGVLSILGILTGLAVHRPPVIRPWILLAIGVAFLLAGVTTLDSNDRLFGHNWQDIDLAGLCFLGGHLVAAASLLLILNLSRSGQLLSHAVDGLMVALAALVLLWVFLVSRYDSDHSLTILQRIMLLAFPAADLGMLTVAARNTTNRVRRAPAIAFVWVALAAHATTTATIAALTLQDGALPPRGHWIDVGWAIWCICLGGAALHPSMTKLASVSEAAPPRMSVARLSMLTVLALVIPIAGTLEAAHQSNSNRIVIGIGSGLLISLVLWRIRESAMHLERERDVSERMARHERALRESAAALMAATDRVTILDRVSATMSELRGGPVAVRLLVQEGGRVTVLSGPESGTAASPAPRTLPSDDLLPFQVSAHSVLDRDQESELKSALRLDVEGKLLLVPIPLHVATRGVLIVPAPPDPRESEDGLLLALATQLSLAFDRVDRAREQPPPEPELAQARDPREEQQDRSWRNHAAGGPVMNMGEASEQTYAKAKLAHATTHDQLTGLPNRSVFLASVDDALTSHNLHARLSCVLVLDLDNFANLAGGLERDVANVFIRQLVDRLHQAARAGDMIARVANNLFAFHLNDMETLQEGVHFAELVRDSLSRPFTSGDHALILRASFGLSLSDRPDVSAVTLLREADLAMVEAKAQGAASIAVYDIDMETSPASRSTLDIDLHRALERQEFELFFQPQVLLSNGLTTCMEALLRWRRGIETIVEPAEFIALAEENDAIIPIGLWVLDEACRQAKIWELQFEERAPTIAVNLSPRQLASDSLVDDIRRALSTHRVSPSKLTLEITERFAVTDTQSHRTTLHRLKELGVQLAIDDFGSGYSSLGYLGRLPVDKLKIDRSFIDGIGKAPDDSVILSAITDLAHKLGLTVVAEGIETNAQKLLVHELRCDLGQGFYFARPMPASLATAYLKLDQLSENGS
jgi:diguanylate cyclase (GGDEF)-like protein